MGMLVHRHFIVETEDACINPKNTANGKEVVAEAPDTTPKRGRPKKKE